MERFGSLNSTIAKRHGNCIDMFFQSASLYIFVCVCARTHVIDGCHDVVELRSLKPLNFV